jgi:tetratricopeptide (TPR) repeat protein
MLCEKLGSFFDGELAPEEAAAVRQHLAGCARCQRELHGLMQLAALDRAMVEERAKARPVPGAGSDGGGAKIIPLRPRMSRALLGAGVMIAAAAAILLVWLRLDLEPGVEIASVTPLPGLAATRPLEGRLSYAGADHYRPYEVQRAAGPAAVEHIPLAALAELEARGDEHGIAAAQVLMGSREQAAHHLERARQIPELALDAESDRALLALLASDPEAALDILDRVVEQAPQHPQALWNRALALRELGLPLEAARAFDRVAALNEPGWSAEARAQAERLRRAAAALEQAWERALEQGRALARTGAGVSAAEVAAQPGLMRSHFYHAVRVADTRVRLDALRPIAQALDRHHGGSVLTAHLDRVGQSDLARRQPLSRTYAELHAIDQPAPEAARALIRDAQRAGAADIALGAMRYTGSARNRVAEDLLPEHRALAEDSGDPWLVLLASEEEAQARIARADYAGAELLLAGALPTCEATPLEPRCARIEYWLGAAYVGLHRVSDARRHLMNAWTQARRSGDWGGEGVVLHQLSELAYRQDDSGTGSIAAARAYLGELALRDPSCANRLRQHRMLATMLVVQNRMISARREMARAAALVADGTCEQPPFSLQVALAQAELMREDGSAAEVAALQAELATFRAGAAESPGKLAFAAHVEGRLLLGRDREAAHALLRRAIAAADELPADVTAQRARSHSYMLLIRDASARGEHERALSLVTEELGVEAAPRCALGIAAEHELIVVARGVDGALVAKSRPLGMAGIPADRAVPETVRQALVGCDVVDVHARAPYLGSARLLPADMAWRFRTRRPPIAPSAARRQRVIVADVEPPARLGLPRLASHPGEPGAVMLRGAAATPAAVMSALSTAGEIEIHAHGILDSAVADAAFLALSPDAGGQYALTADAIRRQRLAGVPRVFLGACHGAYTTRFFHQPSSLASAFVEAGAQTVIASPAPIPDADATALIAALRRRLEAGQPAAKALRDERLRVADATARAWIDEIIVFE